MTNVSKIPLEQAVKQKLFNEFAGLFANSSEQKMAQLFLELFTESEQIMFMKRVGIILMLREQYSNYAISKILQVSPATVGSIQEKYIVGEYSRLVASTKKVSFDSDKFWKVMEVLLSAGLPPRAGRGRWDNVFKVK